MKFHASPDLPDVSVIAEEFPPVPNYHLRLYPIFHRRTEPFRKNRSAAIVRQAVGSAVNCTVEACVRAGLYRNSTGVISMSVVCIASTQIDGSEALLGGCFRSRAERRTEGRWTARERGGTRKHCCNNNLHTFILQRPFRGRRPSTYDALDLIGAATGKKSPEVDDSNSEVDRNLLNFVFE